MSAVDLNSIKTSFLRPDSSIGKFIDQHPDLLDCKRLRRNPTDRIGDGGRAEDLSFGGTP